MKLSAPPPPPPEPNEPGQPSPEPNPPGDAANAPQPPADAAAAAGPKPATWPAWFAGADFVLAVLTVTLAFLVSSFAARNSDIWYHLAAGKRLFAGEYTPGSDPFSYSAADRTWVNHSWLWDAGAYLLYSGTGATLVVLKALAVAGAFVILLAMRRPGHALWPWAAVAAVAVVAAAPYLHLRPIVASFFLLAVTLFLLFRAKYRPDSWQFPIAIGVTFWVWSNVDEWFFLGPLALGLVLAGELFQGKKADGAADEADPLGAPPDVPALARALGVGLVACMLNPHHVHVWQLPFEVVGMKGLTADVRFRQLLLTPLDRFYTDNAGLGYNHNGLAYAVLFVGGGAALGLGAGRVRFSHVALWVGFAVLSLVSIYAIPFLAVVAVPVIASQLNSLSSGVALKTWGDPRTRFVLLGSAGGRAVSLLAVLVACVLAWPGWVNSPVNNPAYAKRVAWVVEPDPAMAKAAAQMQAWREQGLLPADARGFVASVELANHCAWFAPAEKVFANGRYNHHRPEWPDYMTVRTELPLVHVENREGLPDLRKATDVFRRLGVEYVAVHANPGDRRPDRALAWRMGSVQLDDEAEWSVWYLDGRTSIAGWRGAPGAEKPTFAALRVDPVALAFGPNVERLPPGEVQPIRPWGGWEEAFVRSPKVSPPGADEAMAWCEFRDFGLQRLQSKQQATAMLFFLTDRFAGGVGLVYFRTPRVRGDDGLLAAPFLALRAARRAIAADPDHPDGYFALFRVLADDSIPLHPAERAVGQVTALRQCLERMPPPEDYKAAAYLTSPFVASRFLAAAYQGRRQETGPLQIGIPVGGPAGEILTSAGATGVVIAEKGQPVRVSVLDLRARQARGGVFLLPLDLIHEELQRTARHVSTAEVREEDDTKRIVEGLQAELKAVERDLAQANNAYQTRRARAPKVPDQVRLALQHNLAGEALRLLTAKDVDPARDFGAEALPMLLLRVALELTLGRLEDAAADLEQLAAHPDVQQALASPDFQRIFRGLLYQKCLLEGDYAKAGRVLEELEGDVVRNDPLASQRTTFDPKPFVESKQSLTGMMDFAPLTALAAPTPFDLFARISAPGAAIGDVVVRGRKEGEMVAIPGFLTLRNNLAGLRNLRADFFFRRGLLYLYEGDVAEAEKRFLQTRQDAVKEWGLPAYRHADAELYLRLIEQARKK